MTKVPMPRGAGVAVALALLLVVVCATPGIAQQSEQVQQRKHDELSATGRQDLTFEVLLPGVPSAVSRLDATHSGQFEFRGAKRAEVRIELTLPPGMFGHFGQTVPLQFGPGDGGFSPTPSIKNATAFDPRVPLLTVLASSGRLYLFLGATALPHPTQRQGPYASTVTACVAYTGV